MEMRIRRGAVVFGIAFLSSVFQMAAADPVTFESGAKKVQLLELYTSEGCSSCPPAEASLSRLLNDSRLWRDFVPVAFHVDYWDRLGWKDHFASVEWTKRKQNYAGTSSCSGDGIRESSGTQRISGPANSGRGDPVRSGERRDATL